MTDEEKFKLAIAKAQKAIEEAKEQKEKFQKEAQQLRSDLDELIRKNTETQESMFDEQKEDVLLRAIMTTKNKADC